MARKDKSLATGFDGVASYPQKKEVNINNNVNDIVNNIDNNRQDESNNNNTHTSSNDTIDQVLNGDKEKDAKVLTGIYLEPYLAEILTKLGKKGGKGTKSNIVNEALTKLFEEKNLL